MKRVKAFFGSRKASAASTARSQAGVVGHEPSSAPDASLESLLLDLAGTPDSADAIEAVGDFYVSRGHDGGAGAMYAKAVACAGSNSGRALAKLNRLQNSYDNARRLCSPEVEYVISNNDQRFKDEFREFLRRL